MDKSGNVIIMFMAREIKTGGGAYLSRLYDYFVKHGISVYPVYLDDLPKWPRHLGILIDCAYSNFLLYWKIRRYRYIPKITLFEDFHHHPRLLLCNIIMKMANRGVRVVTLMQSGVFDHRVLKNKLLKKMDKSAIYIYFKQVDKILCNSDFTQQVAITEGALRSKTDVVYCGVEGFDNRHVNTKTKRDEKILLFVGQCAPCKGLEHLLNAISLLSEYNVLLNIVGNTDAEPDYFKKMLLLRKELSLEKRAIFHGYIYDREQLFRTYMEADIFVLPSLIEGFGIVLIEAMSAGLPIVATKAGSIPELVRDEENGFLVPPGDPAALADALKHLLDSAKLRERIGANGHTFYLNNRDFYSWDRVGQRVIASMIWQGAL
jgi:glycosyltransferase involved in cell wall biosynthesis